MGSIGIEGIAVETFDKVFSKYSLKDLLEFADEDKELYTKYGDNYKIFYCKGKLLLKIGI